MGKLASLPFLLLRCDPRTEFSDLPTPKFSKRGRALAFLLSPQLRFLALSKYTWVAVARRIN